MSAQESKKQRGRWVGRKRERVHFRRKYKKLRCDKCKQLKHNTRGCQIDRVFETVQEEKEEAQKSRGATSPNTKEGDVSSVINWGWPNAEEKKQGEKVKRKI